MVQFKFPWCSILMCNNSTSAGTSLEDKPMFAHVSLHRTFNPWGASAPGGKMRKQLLKDHNFLNNSLIFIIESSTLVYLLFKKHCIQYISIWKIVLDLVKGTWHNNFMAGCRPCCEQTHAAFEMGLSLDQGQGVYSGRSDVVGSSQVRLCQTCIIDVMPKDQMKNECKTKHRTLGTRSFSNPHPTIVYAWEPNNDADKLRLGHGLLITSTLPKIILSWSSKLFVTRVHALNFIYPGPRRDAHQ